MTPTKRDSPTTTRWTPHRSAIAAYIRARRYLLKDQREAKTIAQIARELRTYPSTVRYWLRRDHAETFLRYWPSINDLLLVSQAEKEADMRRRKAAVGLLAELAEAVREHDLRTALSMP